MLFSGTTEGRLLAEALSPVVELIVSVATAYGAAQLEGLSCRVHCGRMTEAQMIAFLLETKPDVVIDATHPYAEAVTAQLQSAAKTAGSLLWRCLRRPSDLSGCTICASMEELLHTLACTEGNILLTTGSKQMEAFTALPDFSQRIYLRILPDPAAIAESLRLGYRQSHIIAMQGPFSEELNFALCRQKQIAVLVTKDGGAPACFEEKKRAALRAGAQVIVLARPSAEQGYSVDELIQKIKEELL